MAWARRPYDKRVHESGRQGLHLRLTMDLAAGATEEGPQLRNLLRKRVGHRLGGAFGVRPPPRILGEKHFRHAVQGEHGHL
jgi:hypothetical protein